MEKILVTGANGFIGQHLCRTLLDHGYRIRGLRHEKQTLYFISESEVEWVDGDLANSESLKKITDSIDIVVHAGAIPRNDLRKSWNDFYNVNVIGTKNLLEEASKSNIKKFIFISSVEAAGYGDGTNPRTENDPPFPCNNYGKSKLEAEKIVLSPLWKFERTVLRFPMIYGPGTFLIVPKLFGMVKKGIYPFIGSGNTLMEFCYVGNAIESVRFAINNNVSNQLFYISDERPYTIKEVINAISTAMSKKYIPIHLPESVAYCLAFLVEIIAKCIPVPPIVSPFSKKPVFTRETVKWTTRNINFVSIEKIKKLGFKPLYTIDQGCKLTVQWLNENGF